MNGLLLVESFKKFNLPGSEGLSSADYDWLFIGGNKHVNQLWHLITHMSPLSILSPKELTEYKKINQFEILPVHQLEKLGDWSKNASISTFDTKEDEENHTRRHLDKAKLLQQRNSVEMEKLKVRQRLNGRLEYIKTLEVLLEKETINIHGCSSNVSKETTILQSSMQDVMKNISPYTSYINESNSPLEFSLNGWYEEERKLDFALQDFIEKQFQNDIQKIFSKSDESSFLNGSLTNRQLISGRKNADYLKNSTELNRICKMLQIAKYQVAMAQIDEAKFLKELNECSAFLKMLSFRNYSLSVLLQSIREFEDCIVVASENLTSLLGNLKINIQELCEFERGGVISCNYEAKLRRQEYFKNKQWMVIEHFAEQIARYDFLQIIFDLDKQHGHEKLLLLQTIESYLSNQENEFIHRLSILKSYKLQDAESEKRMSALISHFGSETGRHNSADLHEEKNSSARESQRRKINKMLGLCSMLKNIYGEKLSHGFLVCWLDQTTLERQRRLEQNIWDFHQDMLATYRSLHEKKRL